MWHVVETDGPRVMSVNTRNEYDTALELALRMAREFYDEEDETELQEIYERAKETLPTTGVFGDGSYRITVIEGEVRR